MKIGRNDPCPCGSSVKYKRCCGKGESPHFSSSQIHIDDVIEKFDEITNKNQVIEDSGDFTNVCPRCNKGMASMAAHFTNDEFVCVTCYDTLAANHQEG